MGFEVASLVFSGLSTLSSLVQAYSSTKRQRSRPEDKELQKTDLIPDIGSVYQKIIPKRMVHNAANNSISQIDKIIDDDLLNVMNQNIKIASKRLIDAFNDPSNNNQERDKESMIARSVICRELKRIMNYNNGNLPNGELENMWISHGCNN